MRRVNYRGKPVLFPLGVFLVAAAGLSLAAGPSRSLVFLLGVGVLGVIDDLAAGTPRGLRGHGLALVRGEPSTGAIKALGTLGLAGYAAHGNPAEVLVLALAAHVGNLLDTRPGRCEKGLALAAAISCGISGSLAPLAPIAPLLPAVAVASWLTLGERAMLGDSGASLIGGMAGVCLASTLGPLGTCEALAALIAVSLYGEFRSLGAAIERSRALRAIDSLGRA